MTLQQKNRTLSIIAALYAVSFCLPVVYSTHDILLGFHMSVWGIMGFIVHLGSGNMQGIGIDLLLILPNLLMILTFLFRHKFGQRLRYFFFVTSVISAGSWIFTYRLYLSVDEDMSLSFGYWLWFLSVTFYLFVTATPVKKQLSA